MKPIVFFWLLAISIYGQNIMSIPEYSGRSNDTLEIAIKINNANSFVAFQTDVALPPQVSYIPNSAALTGRSNGHMISATLLQNNVLRILAFSVNQSTFLGDTGSVAKFKVKLKTEPGSYPLQLVNPIISNANSSNILTSFENGSITIVSPKLFFYPADIDFGRIPLWSSSDQYVYIQNQGSSDLVIGRLSTENQYFRVVGDTSFTIEPWGNRAITIRFNSLKKGSYSTKLNIRSNDPSNSVASVQLTAVAFAVNELHGLPAFGRSGYPVDLYFSINNMEPVTGFQFDIVTPNALSFIKDSIFLTGRRGDHIVTANYISPNRLRVIAFSPTNKRFTDSLGNIVRIKFDINGTGGNHYYSLENVILSDSAASNVVSASYPSYVNIASPDIQGSSDIFFGEVPVTDTAVVSYQILNQGSDTLRINSITSNDPSFWTGFASPLIIPEGSAVTLNVFFHKPLKGNYTGRLMIRSNDPDSDPLYINLSATAFVPNYMIADSITGLTNETVATAISVDNYEPFVAFQVDYVVPDGLVYIPNSARLTNRSVDHMVSVASIGNNTYRIVAFSPTQKQFKGNYGEIVNLGFTTGGNTGEFPLVLMNGILSNSASQNIIKGTQNGILTLLNRPGAPNLVSPQNYSTNISTSPLISWQIELSSTSYTLQLAVDSSFNDIMFTRDNIPGPNFQVNNLSLGTKYFWRVRGHNSISSGNWSSVRSFTTVIGSQLAPSLVYPTNYAKGVVTPILFVWNVLPNVQGYHLQVSEDFLFGTLVFENTMLTDTSQLVLNLNDGTKYFWRVRAVNAGGQSDWSSVWNFKTLGNPYASNLYEPLNDAVNLPLNGITFKWTKANERIETIQKYQLQLSTDSLFGTTVLNDSTLTDTVKIVDGLSYLTKHFWRVRAQNQTGWGEWSSTWRFTTIIEKPTVPLLASPGNNSLGLLNPIATKWNKALRAEKYHLQVSTDNLFTTFVVNDSTVTDTTKLLPTLSNYSQYYWRVKAMNIGGVSEWSTVWNFKTLGNPYASTPLTPLDASINQPLNGLTFKWTKAKERIETIQKYQFQVSTDSLFGSFFVNDSTLADTSRIVNGMGYLTKYFWRVRAQNETGWGDWSIVWRFTTIIEKPTVPVLASPANGSLGLLNPVSVSWKKALRVETYSLQVSTDSLFGSFIVDQQNLVDTTKVLPTLSNYAKYFWRVKAVNVGGESNWSSTFSFKTLGNPYASTPVQPADQAVNQPINGLVIKWTKAKERIEAIQKYQLQISTDSLFATTFVNDSTLTDTTKTVGGMGYLTKYFWRVRAKNETGWGDWSIISRFTSIIERPATPVLANPLNDTLGLLNPISVNWNKALRAEKYTLQVSTDILFGSFIVYDSTLTDTTKYLPNLANYTQYYWRVKATNVGGESDWSTVWNFKTLGNPYASNLITPLDNSVNQSLNGLTFKWTKAKERIEAIQKYQFQISTDSLFATVFVNDSTLTDTIKVVGGMGYLTKHFWRVRAQNQTGWGDWSVTWRFTTIIEKPTVPVLALPVNGSKGLLNPISTKWNKSLRAEKYTLQVSTDSLFGSFIVYDSTLTDTTKYLPNLANYTQYYWRVKAVNIGGESDWSTVLNFKTLGNSYASTLITPLDASINQPLNSLTFKWTKANERIETIQKYQFQVSTDSLFGSFIVNDTTLTDTTRIVNGLSYLTKYFWRVRAQNETGWGDWSDTWRFTTIIEKPTTPLLASPVNNAVGLLNSVVVGWNSAARVERYRLQVSADSLFSTFVVNDSSLTDTSKILPELSSYTKHFWRVQAINIGGVSAWSTVWNFKTLGSPYASNLIEPLNNSVNHPLNGVVFKWRKANERIETIQKYQLQVSTDSVFPSLFINDSTLTDTSRIVSGMSHLTKYFWRVRAQNETGWGDWSSTWRFTTIIERPAVPLLASPANNSTQQLQPVTLKWRPALRASIYTLEVSEDQAFGTLIITDSTITDTLRVLPQLEAPKTYYWRVKARNIGGVSEYSEAWNFRTLGLPLSVNLVSPLNGAVNQPVNNLMFVWSNGGEQNFRSETYNEEPKDKPASLNSVKGAGTRGKTGGNQSQLTGGSFTGSPQTIGKYWLEITTDTLGATFFYSDSTITDTTKLVSGFTHLTGYYWRVKARNEVGWGQFSGWNSFTTIIEGPGVTLLVSPQDQSTGNVQPITVKWRTAPRAEKYTLEVSDNPGFTSFIVRDTNLTDTVRVLPALAPLQEYYWRVYSLNTGGISDTSAVWRFKTLGAPTTVSLIYPVENALNIPVDLTFTWTRATDQEAILGYWFELATDTAVVPVIKDTLLTDTLKAVNQLAHNTSYFWRVKAKNETGWGNFTAWGRFKTVKRVIAPPSNLVATAVAVGRVRLDWSDNSDNESGFVIARKTGDSTSLDPLVILDTVAAGVTQYLDSLVSDTTLYSYIVVGYNNDTISLPSNYAQVFTLTGIKELFADQLPKNFDLYQNYPNPFNPSTMIRFAIPRESRVRIELYSMQGELITVLMSEEMTAGYYETRLDIPNYASGIYLYRIIAQPVDGLETFTLTKKLILVK